MIMRYAQSSHAFELLRHLLEFVIRGTRQAVIGGQATGGGQSVTRQGMTRRQSLTRQGVAVYGVLPQVVAV